MDDRKELKRLLKEEDWQEGGSIQCPIHGGDHQALIYTPPFGSKEGDRTFCDVEGVFVN